MADRRLLETIADAVLERRPVDWAAAESSATDSQRVLVRQLHAVAALTSFRMVQDPRAVADQHAGRAPEWPGLEILDKVGSGSFGSVYRAWDRHLQRPVALKLIPASTDVETVLAEGRMLARVDHPNVVRIYGADYRDGYVGLEMEFVEGETLDDVVARDGPLSIDEFRDVAGQLCAAVRAVHDAALVHRDIKPRNVMRTKAGRVVLMDFGLGRLAPAADPNDISGTPLYLAPEIFDGAPPSPRTDVYGLAVVLYFLLTGRHPIEGDSLQAIRDAIAARTIAADVRIHRKELRRPLADAIARGLAFEPARRFDSADALRSAVLRSGATRRWLWLSAAAVAAPIAAAAVVTFRPHAVSGAAPVANVAAVDHRSFDDVTTSSKEALRYYLEANDAGEQGQWPASYDLAREAVRIDPQFASAEIWMAWSALNTQRRSEARAHADRALALADRVSVWERDWIRGSYYILNTRFADAIDPLEALLRLKPDHQWAVSNLATACAYEHRRSEATPFVTRAARLRPGDFETNVTAASAIVMDTGDATAALSYVRAALSAASRAPDSQAVRANIKWLYYFPVFERWTNGDIDAAARLFDDAVNGIAARPPAERQFLAEGGGAFGLTLGQLGRAQELLARLPDDRLGQRFAWLGVAAYEAGNNDDAVRLLSRHLSLMAPGQVVGVTAARLGLVDELQPHIRDTEARVAETPMGTVSGREWLAGVRGELMIRNGDTAAALATLENATRMTAQTGLPVFFLASESLARARAEIGQTRDAIQALEAAALEKGRTYAILPTRDSTGYLWIRTQAELVALYHEVGRERDEAALRSVLLSHLKYSDPAHPIRVTLERSAASHHSAANGSSQ